MTVAEDTLNQNYYKKQPGESFVKDRTYYFLTKDRYNTIKGECKQVNPDGSCEFHIWGKNLGAPLENKSNTIESWWRYGNSVTSGKSAGVFQQRQRQRTQRQRQRTQRQRTQRTQRQRTQRQRQRRQRR